MTYTHRAFFRPEACGVHELYAHAWVDNQRNVLGEFTTAVTIRPEESLDALLASTRGTEMAAELRLGLLLLLKVSQDDFEHHRKFAGARGLDRYVRRLPAASGREIREDFAKRLIGRAQIVTACVSEGAVSPAESEPAIASSGGRE